MAFEWHDVEQKLEEDEFKEEKQAEQTEQAEANREQAQQAPGSSDRQQSSFEKIGLASIVYESWNNYAVDKGYSAINETQKAFLDKHTVALEQKYLSDMELLPEIEALLAHVVVYVPKYTAHMKDKTKTKE